MYVVGRGRRTNEKANPRKSTSQNLGKRPYCLDQDQYPLNVGYVLYYYLIMIRQWKLGHLWPSRPVVKVMPRVESSVSTRNPILST